MAEQQCPLASSLGRRLLRAFPLRCVEQLFPVPCPALLLEGSLRPFSVAVVFPPRLLSFCSSPLMLSPLSNCQRPALVYSSDKNEKNYLPAVWLCVSIDKLYVFDALWGDWFQQHAEGSQSIFSVTLCWLLDCSFSSAYHRGHKCLSARVSPQSAQYADPCRGTWVSLLIQSEDSCGN